MGYRVTPGNDEFRVTRPSSPASNRQTQQQQPPKKPVGLHAAPSNNRPPLPIS
jgi:hypothetical protein